MSMLETRCAKRWVLTVADAYPKWERLSAPMSHFDRSFSFPIWREADLSNKVVRIPDHASTETVLRILNRSDVRLAFVSDEPRVRSALERANPPFFFVFSCEASCVAMIRP